MFPKNSIQPQGQWDDFLVRRVDTYALTKYNILLNWLGDLNNKNILVIGSGSGEFPILLSKAGANVLATDIDEPSIKLTKKTAALFGISLKTMVTKVEDIKTDTLFDIVVATDVIEHIEDDKNAFNCILNLTKNSGRIVITVPAFNFLFGLHDRNLGHFRRYTKKTLTAIFPKNIKILKMRYFGFFGVPVALILSRILERPYPVMQVGLNVEKKTFFGLFVKIIFFIEKVFLFPIGTSLLSILEKKTREDK